MTALTTLIACAALLGAATLAIGVLPWSDEELQASERAWATLLASIASLAARVASLARGATGLHPAEIEQVPHRRAA